MNIQILLIFNKNYLVNSSRKNIFGILLMNENRGKIKKISFHLMFLFAEH